MGAYSYAKIGTYESAGDSKRVDLQAPVANNRVWFAGEATHNTHSATVVGALHEGERAANEVHSINGDPNNPPLLDSDSDGFEDSADNCLAVANADQRDTDGDGYGNLCDADLDGDCTVGFGDLAELKAVFFTGDVDGDLDGNGNVDFSDLAIMKALFFAAPGPSGLSNDCDEQ